MSLVLLCLAARLTTVSLDTCMFSIIYTLKINARMMHVQWIKRPTEQLTTSTCKTNKLSKLRFMPAVQICRNNIERVRN